jgi:hypothetical protein
MLIAARRMQQPIVCKAAMTSMPVFLQSALATERCSKISPEAQTSHFAGPLGTPTAGPLTISDMWEGKIFDSESLLSAPASYLSAPTQPQPRRRSVHRSVLGGTLLLAQTSGVFYEVLCQPSNHSDPS